MQMFRRTAATALLLVAWLGTASAQKGNPSFDLIAAVRANDAATAARLLDQGASPNARNRLGDTALNLAARDGRLELARLLLAHGADVDQPNLARVTPLMSAAFGSHDELVRELLEHKADPRPEDQVHKTALIYAAGNGDAGCLQAILDASGEATANQRDPQGATPLMWAAAYGKVDNIALLLKRGADVQARDSRGMSALAIAVEQKQDEAVKVLQVAGAR